MLKSNDQKVPKQAEAERDFTDVIEVLRVKKNLTEPPPPPKKNVIK